MGYTVRIEGLERVRRRLGGLPDVAKRETAAGLKRMGAGVAAKVRAYTPVASGRTQSAIKAKAETDLRVVVAGHGIDDVVMASISGGTRPHWAPWGPGSNLAAWAIQKGIPPFIVAKTIANFGTIKRFGRPQGGPHMFEKGLADSQGEIRREVQQIAGRIVRGF